MRESVRPGQLQTAGGRGLHEERSVRPLFLVIDLLAGGGLNPDSARLDQDLARN